MLFEFHTLDSRHQDVINGYIRHSVHLNRRIVRCRYAEKMNASFLTNKVNDVGYKVVLEHCAK